MFVYNFIDRLADLAEEFELERPPSIDDLLSCIVNRDDVENIIFKPVIIPFFYSLKSFPNRRRKGLAHPL
jgi:hypothetical protein